MSDTSTPTTDKLQRRAGELASDAQEAMADSAKSEMDELRQNATAEADSAADAARAASREFDSGSLQAEALKQVSRQIETFTSRLRDKPIDDLVDDVAVFARKNPLVFLGGAAIAGFAVARFLKSGSDRPTGAAPASDPWSGYLDTKSGGSQ